jgi:hypothetical protein
MDKNVIQALVVVSAGDEELAVRANIIEALRLILKGIEANELRKAHGIGLSPLPSASWRPGAIAKRRGPRSKQ